MSNRDTVFRVIYKVNGIKRTAIVTAKDKDAVPKRIKRGARIVSISKLDTMGMFGLGDATRILLPDKKSLIGEGNFFKKKFSDKGSEEDDYDE